MKASVAGFLWKLGGEHKSWKRRWFMLSDGVLYYFRDLPEFEPIATIDLGNTTVQSSGPREFQLQTPQRAFSLRAGDPAACEAWKEALQTQENVVMGFMEKRGQHNAVYRHRWFCLDPDDHTLSYFREAPEFAPIGAVQLRDVCSRPRLATSDRLHCFVVDTPERVFVMSASCAQEAQHWVEQLGLEIEQRLSAVEKQSLLAVHAGRLLRQVKGSISAYHCELHGRPSGSAELRAFEQADSAVPAWSMPLSPTTDVVSFERHARNATRSGHSGDSSYFSFMLEHGGQRFRFAAETEAAGRCWLSALAAYTRCKEDVMETSVAHEDPLIVGDDGTLLGSIGIEESPAAHGGDLVAVRDGSGYLTASDDPLPSSKGPTE